MSYTYTQLIIVYLNFKSLKRLNAATECLKTITVM